MDKENNHIIIEVLNSNGDIKLTKMRNPQAIWQNNNYPDGFVFRDVDYINIFQLIQKNKHLKEKIDRAIEIFEECEKTNDFSICDIEMYEILKGENEKV